MARFEPELADVAVGRYPLDKNQIKWYEIIAGQAAARATSTRPLDRLLMLKPPP